MSACDFNTNENPAHSSESLCNLVSIENITKNEGKIMTCGTESEESSLSSSENLSDFNESVVTSDYKTVLNHIENHENSLFNTDSSLSSVTTSPVVLYLRSENDINEENSVDVLQNKSDNKERPFSCNICDKTFKRRNHYNVHLYTHKTERPFKCKLCNKAFTHHYFLKRHVPIHNTIKQFSCEYCNEEFSVRRYYTRHIRRHLKKKYECDACDFICYKLKESIAHVKTHSGVIFSCDKCSRCFCQELSLNLHHCFESDEKRFHCKLCTKTFRKVCYLHSHEAAHENNRSFVCDMCMKGFNTKNALAVHIQMTHEEDNEIKPYSCHICDKKFHLQVNLKRHKKVHEKESQALNTNSIPVLELQSRINQKQSDVQVGYLNIEAPIPLQQLVYFIPGKKIKHVCNICLKGFKERHTLTVHYRRHMGEKPFECEFCSKRFADKSDLKRHRRIHTGERKYVCNPCDKAFTRKSYLTAHMRICPHHRVIPKITSVFSINQDTE